MIELFAGIGATHEAMTELGIPVEIVGISEIDPYAVEGYEAIHGPVTNLGDITKLEHLPDADLVTYSYPCQSVSVAGLKQGMKEGTGTTSSLLWEVGRLLADMRERGRELPEVLLMENVDQVLNRHNRTDFNRWITILSDLGYTSSWKVLNAKDYGTPQFRRRCFVVSTRTHGKFKFPPKTPDTRVLRDVLEDHIDPDYFMPAKFTDTFTPIEVKQSSDNLIQVGNLNLKGWFESILRIYGQDGISPCVVAAGGVKMVKIVDTKYSNKIRTLTPRECMRLQAFPEDTIDRLFSTVKGRTNQYRLAGNSIAVCCLTAIFKGIYIDKTFVTSGRQVSLEGWVIA